MDFGAVGMAGRGPATRPWADCGQAAREPANRGCATVVGDVCAQEAVGRLGGSIASAEEVGFRQPLSTLAGGDRYAAVLRQVVGVVLAESGGAHPEISDFDGERSSFRRAPRAPERSGGRSFKRSTSSGEGRPATDRIAGSRFEDSFRSSRDGRVPSLTGVHSPDAILQWRDPVPEVTEISNR